MNPDFIYLPQTDRVVFVQKIEQIEVGRKGGKVNALKVILDSTKFVVTGERDLQVICQLFMIPLITKQEKNNV